MVGIKVPRIHPAWWILIILVISSIPIGITITINVLIETTSWWLTGAVAIIEVVFGIIIGVIALVVRLQKQQPPKVRLDPKTAKELAIHNIKYDTDNPDNFIPDKQIIKRVGSEGNPRTPILHLSGDGSETDTKIDVIINLDNPKLEMSRLDNASDIEVEEVIRGMAEHPEIIEIEKTTTKFDQYNRPVTDTEKRKVSHAEKQAFEEEKAQDLRNII